MKRQLLDYYNTKKHLYYNKKESIATEPSIRVKKLRNGLSNQTQTCPRFKHKMSDA